MVQLSVNTDNIAISSLGVLQRGGLNWDTLTVGGAHKGWNQQRIDLTGTAKRELVFVPLALNTQWMEPPAAWFGSPGDVKESVFPMIRLFDLFTTKPLTEQFITDELLHLTDPYIFGIGAPSTLYSGVDDDDGEFDQLILGRARTFTRDTGVMSKGLGFNRMIQDTTIGSGSAVASRFLYYTRAYYVYLNGGDTEQFMDMPSQRALITGEFISPNELERFQTIAQNKGVGGW